MATIEKEKALDVVRQMVADGQVSQEVAEKYFPELAESNDEKIRKEIIATIHLYYGEPLEDEAKEMIAWLEKQAEQKPVTDFSDIKTWKYIVDAVWTEKEGIGQYLDSPFTEEVAKKLQKRFGDIDQKSNELPNGDDYGIDSLWHAQRILEKTLGEVEGYQSDDGILEHKCAISAVKNLYEQKPAWSEEDEKCIRLSMDIIESALRAGFCVQLDRDRCVDWLNSLRSQKQWRPSEDQMKALAEALSLAKNCGEESAFDLRTLHEQLKKLRKE